MISLLRFFRFLISRWPNVIELLDHVHPVIGVTGSPLQPKTQNKLHVLQCDCHLAARKVEGVGLQPRPVGLYFKNRSVSSNKK